MNNTVSDEVSLVAALVAQATAAQDQIAIGLETLGKEYGQPITVDIRAVIAQLGNITTCIANDAEAKTVDVTAKRRGHKAPATERDKAAAALRTGLANSRAALRNQYGVEQVGQVYPSGDTPSVPADLITTAKEVIANLVPKSANWTQLSNVVVPVDCAVVSTNLAGLLSKLEATKDVTDQSHAANVIAGTQSVDARVRLHRSYKGYIHILTGLLELVGDEHTAEGLRVHYHDSKLHEPSGAGSEGSEKKAEETKAGEKPSEAAASTETKSEPQAAKDTNPKA